MRSTPNAPEPFGSRDRVVSPGSRALPALIRNTILQMRCRNIIYSFGCVYHWFALGIASVFLAYWRTNEQGGLHFLLLALPTALVGEGDPVKVVHRRQPNARGGRARSGRPVKDRLLIVSGSTLSPHDHRFPRSPRDHL